MPKLDFGVQVQVEDPGGAYRRTESGRLGANEAEKRAAGYAALEEVESGMLLGLGTGSTVEYFLQALSQGLESGRIRDIRGVPTSSVTEERCRQLAIPTLDLSEGISLDLVVDGADEVSPELDLVKGLGGALLREKIVAQAANRFAVICDSAKEVTGLGARAPIPVEVTPFAWKAHLPFFRSLGAEPRPRTEASGALFITDNGNHLVDLRFDNPVASPELLEADLQARAGVIETGLFLGMADRVFVGKGEQVMSRERER